MATLSNLLFKTASLESIMLKEAGRGDQLLKFIMRNAPNSRVMEDLSKGIASGYSGGANSVRWMNAFKGAPRFGGQDLHTALPHLRDTINGGGSFIEDVPRVFKGLFGRNKDLPAHLDAQWGKELVGLINKDRVGARDFMARAIKGMRADKELSSISKLRDSANVTSPTITAAPSAAPAPQSFFQSLFR